MLDTIRRYLISDSNGNPLFRDRRTPIRTGTLLLLGFLIAAGTGCTTSSASRNTDGVRQYQAGNYQGAIQTFQKTLTNDPDDADAYYNLAATYYALGKKQSDPKMLEQAEGLYHQCLDLSPDNTDCYRGLAALLVDTNRPDSAFTLLQRWQERSPNITAPRVELARLYEEFGDRDSARRYLTDAIQLDQNDARAWAGLAFLRERDGELEQAVANYQQAYQLNPKQEGIAQRIASIQERIASQNTPATNRY